MARIVNDSLIPSKLNAPLDVRTEVNTLADIPKIENPCPSLKIWVKETGKTYKVKSFKEVPIEGTDFTKKVINEYEEDLDEAPSDGKMYVRKNKNWVEGIQEAPSDGLQYVRKNGEWVKIDTGSTYETVMVTISPNDEALKGAIVTIRDESDGKILLQEPWQGTLLTCQVGDGVIYTVSVDSIEGYVSPASVTNKAVRGAVRDIPMKYTLSTLTINISSNQTSDEIIEAVKASVSWGDTTIEVSNGETITIPLNVKVVIEYPEVEGYRTPDKLEYTHTSGADVKNASYDTEALTVSVMADYISDSVNGQTVTINGKEYTYQDTPISVKIPFGTEYSIVSNSKHGYTTPPTQKFTASRSSRNVSMIYERILVGIWIEDTDGRLHSKDEWDGSKVANSVVYVSDERSFRIGLNFVDSIKLSSEVIYANEVWGKTTQYDNTQSGEVFINDIINKFPNKSLEGVKYCKNYLWPNGDVGAWPFNKNEGLLIRENILRISETLNIIKDFNYNNVMFWVASTYADSNNKNWMFAGMSLDSNFISHKGSDSNCGLLVIKDYEL